MEDIKKPEESNGLLPGRLGCHFSQLSFKSKSSRADYHKKFHQNKHRWMKEHRKSPDFVCEHCNIGYGSRRSQWNHEQICQSNPEVLKQLKMRKKVNAKLKKQEQQANHDQTLRKKGIDTNKKVEIKKQEKVEVFKQWE